MASSFEKSVKGGTKIKLAAPKSKYVEHILVATHAGEAGVAEVFRALQNRLRDSTWTVVFKSLIIIHMMIREGELDVTLKYLSQSPSRKLAISNFTEVQTQGRNIRTYAEYLLERARAYGSTKVDYVRGGEGRLKRLSIDKGLLRETEAVQDQIRALVKCELLSDEPENEITLVAFRLLILDLLVLFHIMNEGTINVLEHYFEMSHPDAARALNIYRTFCKQTELVVQYLGNARIHEHSTRIEIPKIKHAPTSLAKSLEEYLNAPDFETSRRQYLAAKDAKRNNKTSNGSSEAFYSAPVPPKIEEKQTLDAKPSAPSAAKQQVKPAPDLIDFFESIEQNQQPMAQQGAQGQYDQSFPVAQSAYSAPQMGIQAPGPVMAQQQTGFHVPSTGLPQSQYINTVQPNNPYGQPQQLSQVQPQQPQQMQPNFTSAGFSGYTNQGQPNFSPQPTALSSIPQGNTAAFVSPNPPAAALQTQSTNPFRQSMMPTQAIGLNPDNSGAGTASQLNRSPTNPFARNASPAQQPVTPMPPQSHPGGPSHQATQIQYPQQQQQQQQTLQSFPTGTNPFARNASPSNSSPAPSQLQHTGLMANQTGSTNPFRQSIFTNQQTGQAWQSNQGTIGGLEQLQTVPIFPRPGQALPQHEHEQQQRQGWQ